MNQIKIVLEEKGIRHIWLSEKLKKSYSMTNSYVQNSSQPSLEVLNKIVDLINIDIKDLIVNSKNG
jgi:putative transcriptional regulator